MNETRWCQFGIIFGMMMQAFNSYWLSASGLIQLSSGQQGIAAILFLVVLVLYYMHYRIRNK